METAALICEIETNSQIYKERVKKDIESLNSLLRYKNELENIRLQAQKNFTKDIAQKKHASFIPLTNLRTGAN
jgi:hypothetical protein